MPLYEYRCVACGAQFELLVMGSNRPVCPDCQSPKLDKQLSTFNPSGPASAGVMPSFCETGGGGGGGCCGGMCAGHN